MARLLSLLARCRSLARAAPADFHLAVRRCDLDNLGHRNAAVAGVLAAREHADAV
jgi:hypothetical protein